MRTTIKGLRRQCIPSEAACTLVRHHVDNKLVGYTFATRWAYRKMKGLLTLLLCFSLPLKAGWTIAHYLAYRRCLLGYPTGRGSELSGFGYSDSTSK